MEEERENSPENKNNPNNSRNQANGNAKVEGGGGGGGGSPLDTNKLQGKVFAEQYQLLEKLGSGAFGVIYRTKDLKNQDLYYGCKVEIAETKHPQIIFEARLLNYLHNNNSKPVLGFPRCFYFDRQGDYNIMVMELLGNSLEQLFSSCNRKFSLKTVLMLADQMLQRTEYLHTRKFLHRDIKPDNFLMGIGKREGRVYMIDFGLAKRYIKVDHIPYKDGKNLTGTARYASINTHVGLEQSRRDDLESLAYVFLYFLKGQLPWQNIRAKDKKEKYEKIRQKKQNTSVEDLCANLPDEFAGFLNYAKSLKFEEKPDYTMCRNIFKELMIKQDFDYDFKFDWKIKEELNSFVTPSKQNLQASLLINSKPNNAAMHTPIPNNNNNNVLTAQELQRNQFNASPLLQQQSQRTRFNTNELNTSQENNNQRYNNQYQQQQLQQNAIYQNNKAIVQPADLRQSLEGIKSSMQPEIQSLQTQVSHQGTAGGGLGPFKGQDGFQNYQSSAANMHLTDVQQQELINIQSSYLEAQNQSGLGGNMRTNFNAKGANQNNFSPIQATQIQPQIPQNHFPGPSTSALAKQGNQILNNNSQLHYYQQQHQQQMQQRQNIKNVFSAHQPSTNAVNGQSSLQMPFINQFGPQQSLAAQTQANYFNTSNYMSNAQQGPQNGQARNMSRENSNFHPNNNSNNNNGSAGGAGSFYLPSSQNAQKFT